MSTWTITFTDTFLNELLNLPPSVSRRVSRKVRILEQDPVSAQGDAKQLQGYEDVYRVRIGDYRLLYTFGQGWVKLLRVRHRNEVYNSIPLTPHTPSPPSPPIEREQHQTQVAVLIPVKVHSSQSTPVDAVTNRSTTTALPYELTESLLKQWHIPSEYWSDLLNVPNSEAILELPLPDKLLNRILDNLFPRSIAEIAAQAEYVLQPPEAAGVEVITVDALARRTYIEHYGEPTFARENQCLGCLQKALEMTTIPASSASDREAIQEKLKQLGLSYLLQERSE